MSEPLPTANPYLFRELVLFMEEMHWLNIPKEEVLAVMRSPDIARRPLPREGRPSVAQCAICGNVLEGSAIRYDHDHQTGRFRGWLCNTCNTGLGMFLDNPRLLEKARIYLVNSLDCRPLPAAAPGNTQDNALGTQQASPSAEG